MNTAIVTGGARGIGAAVVRRLSREGWRVAFSFHSSEGAARLLSHETGAMAFRADLSSEEETLRFLRGAQKQLVHVDALILNAGMAHTGLVTQTDPAVWDRLFAVNVRSAFLAVRELLPGMLSRRSGSVVLVSSMWGRVGASCEAAYAASKAALIGFGKSLAREAGPAGIRVNCVAPGAVDTDMLAGYTPEERRALGDAAPLGRLGTPEEVAQAVVFLAGGEASFISGQVLGVDGGWVS